jgi:hypothetical protein
VSCAPDSLSFACGLQSGLLVFVLHRALIVLAFDRLSLVSSSRPFSLSARTWVFTAAQTRFLLPVFLLLLDSLPLVFSFDPCARPSFATIFRYRLVLPVRSQSSA